MAWYTIDRKLITIKVFYFLTLSSVATLLPYLPIFLTQIGIQQKELGVIYGLIFFTTFFKNLFIGFVADKFQKHKVILILSCIFSAALYASFVTVPPVPSPVLVKSSQTIVKCTNSSSNDGSLSQLEDNNFPCILPLPCDERSEACLHSKSPICDMYCYNNQTTVGKSPLNLTFVNSTDSAVSTNLSESQDFQCQIFFNCEYSPPPAEYTSFTFWMSLIIGVTAALFGSNELMMNDAIALSLLGDDRRKWGRSRLWGSAGYGLSALLVSVLIHRLGSNDYKRMSTNDYVTDGNIDYTPAFYIYMCLSLSCGFVAYFHPTGNMIKSSQPIKGLCRIVKNIRVISFLSIILVLGFFNGIIIAFAYYYLKTVLGANQLVIGGCVGMTVIVEFPILFVGGRIVNKIGTMSCLYLALIAYAIRFLSFAYIPDARWAILVEMTHMFTFGLMYLAANMHIGKITAKGYTGTMIGLMNGIKWGLGLGLGSLSGGMIAEVYRSDDDVTGMKTLFLMAGVGSIIVLIFFVFINEVVIRFCCPRDELETEDDVAVDIKLSSEVKQVADTEIGNQTEIRDLIENQQKDIVKEEWEQKLVM